jgi:hypothetical protein
MLRREAIKGIGAFVWGATAVKQLAPWLEKAPTPAQDLLTEFLDEAIPSLPPDKKITALYVSNTFYRRLVLEAGFDSAESTKGVFKDIPVVSTPGLGNLVGWCINGGEMGSFSIKHYTHIKGIELLLESERPTR